MQVMGISVEPKRAYTQFYRRRAFLVAVLLIASIAIFTAIGFILLSQRSQAENLVTFTCTASDDRTVFSVAVDVNIADGLDENEAVTITQKVFERMPRPDNYRFQSSVVECNKDEDGVWNVKPTLTFTRYNQPWPHTVVLLERLVISYDMVINPFDQTVKYIRSQSKA